MITAYLRLVNILSKLLWFFFYMAVIPQKNKKSVCASPGSIRSKLAHALILQFKLNTAFAAPALELASPASVSPSAAGAVSAASP